jgi:hypothetical protein
MKLFSDPRRIAARPIGRVTLSYGRKRRNRQQIPLLNCKERRWEFCTLSTHCEVRPFHSCYSLLGAFAKLRKATITSFVMSVRLSVRMDRLSSHLTGFHEIIYLNILRKSVKKI